MDAKSSGRELGIRRRGASLKGRVCLAKITIVRHARRIGYVDIFCGLSSSCRFSVSKRGEPSAVISVCGAVLPTAEVTSNSTRNLGEHASKSSCADRCHWM